MKKFSKYIFTININYEEIYFKSDDIKSIVDQIKSKIIFKKMAEKKNRNHLNKINNLKFKNISFRRCPSPIIVKSFIRCIKKNKTIAIRTIRYNFIVSDFDFNNKNK